jgi:hypothetical protein
VFLFQNLAILLLNKRSKIAPLCISIETAGALKLENCHFTVTATKENK